MSARVLERAAANSPRPMEIAGPVACAVAWQSGIITHQLSKLAD
jgi:hypothetical protein